MRWRGGVDDSERQHGFSHRHSQLRRGSSPVVLARKHEQVPRCTLIR